LAAHPAEVTGEERHCARRHCAAGAEAWLQPKRSISAGLTVSVQRWKTFLRSTKAVFRPTSNENC